MQTNNPARYFQGIS